MTTAPDPSDAELVEAILSKMEMEDRTTELQGLYQGHMERVMTATVGKLNVVTGISFSIPDYFARDIILQGGTDMLGRLRSSIASLRVGLELAVVVVNALLPGPPRLPSPGRFRCWLVGPWLPGRFPGVGERIDDR